MPLAPHPAAPRERREGRRWLLTFHLGGRFRLELRQRQEIIGGDAGRMTIGELAKTAGINPRTVRFYEQKGLLPAAGRSDSNYRQYTEKQVALLAFIRRAQAFGLSLGEIKKLLEYRLAGQCAGVRSSLEDLLGAKITDLRTRAAELVEFARELEVIRRRLRRAATSDAHPAPSFCECLSVTPKSGSGACARKRLDLTKAESTGGKGGDTDGKEETHGAETE